MNKLTRGILIDAVNRQVREVNFINFEDMKRQMNVEWVTVGADLKTNHKIRQTVWVDDEGLLNNPDHFFVIDGGYQPYAGNGMIAGTSSHGNTVDCRMTVEEVEKMVHYMTLADVQECIRRGIVDYYGHYLFPFVISLRLI